MFPEPPRRTGTAARKIKCKVREERGTAIGSRDGDDQVMFAA